jgi:hypothetical protein
MPTDLKRKFGPNAVNLLARFIARESIPPDGGFADGVEFFTNAERRHQVLERAVANFDLAIEAVRAAPDNPYGNDEETIAAAILERLKP